MQQVFGIHAWRAPDGTEVRRTARFRMGLKANALTALGEPGAPAGATLAATLRAAALRNLALPIADPRKAAQVVPFEVDGQVPYDIDEAVVGQEPVTVSRDGTAFLVAVAPRDQVAELIQAHGGGDRPQVILPEAYALHAFARALALPADGPVLAVDLRPGRFLMVCLDGGRGGRWRAGRGRDVPFEPVSPYLPETVAADLRRAAQSIVVETGAVPARVLVTGEAGGAALPGELKSAVAKALGLEPVSMKEAAAGMAEAAGHDPEALGLHAVAVGAGLAALNARRRMNLRAGPFALVKEGEGIALGRVARVGVGLLIVLAFAWGDGLVRMHAAGGRLEAAKAALEAQYREVFPDAVRVVDPLVQAKSALDALSARSLLFGGGDTTALGVLEAASSAIPKSLTIDVLELSMEGNRVRMEAEAASFDAIDQIRDQLQARPEFTEVRVSDAKASAKDARVKFRVALTLAEGI